jgi:KDO2-lipid IV(A) lauroyltransferase
MKLRKRIKRDAVYRVIRVVIAVFNWLPRKLAVYLGGWVTLAVWMLLPREKHKFYRHLSLVYGDNLTPRAKDCLGRSFFVNTGRNAADVMRFRKHFTRQIKLLVDSEGMEHFDAAYRLGKGALGITGHIGNFELLAAFIQSEGYEVAVIGRELYHPGLNRILVANREAVGLTNIATTDSPKRVLKWLNAGRALGVLIDTDSSRVRSMFVPAFGRWSSTPIGQTILGLKTGAAFLPMACLRAEDNRYKVTVKPPLKIKPTGDFDADVYNVTLRCTQALEEIIDRHRDQWIWQHNRWRTKR